MKDTSNHAQLEHPYEEIEMMQHIISDMKDITEGENLSRFYEQQQ